MRYLRFLLAFAVIAVTAVGSTWAEEQELQVFLGNLHSHTAYSDGKGTPEEAYVRAKNQAGHDFFLISEHNHSQAGRIATEPALYVGPDAAAIIPTASRLTQNGAFVALYGLEFSTTVFNHLNIISVSKVIRDLPEGDDTRSFYVANPDVKGLLEQLRTRNEDVIIQLNHPDSRKRKTEYGKASFASVEEWVRSMNRFPVLVEVFGGKAKAQSDTGEFNSPKTKDYFHYLGLGLRAGASTGQDNHYKTWGTLNSIRTGVIAPRLSRDDILAGLKARHVYASTDHNLKVILHVNSHLCGDVVTYDNAEDVGNLTIAYSIADADEPRATYTVEVYAGQYGTSNRDLLAAEPVAGDSKGTILGPRYDPSMAFIQCLVYQDNIDGEKDVVVVTPVWFDRGAPAEELAPTPEDTTQYVASRHSKLYHPNPNCPAAKQIRAENRVVGPAAAENRQRHDCPTEEE
jgi:hypothetical protein